MNSMNEKLINDGSETRQAKINLISTCIGVGLILLGVVCLGIKAVSVEYIDASGLLHENFFLLPIGFLLLFGGFSTFFVTGIRNILLLVREKTLGERKGFILYLAISTSIVVIFIVLFLLLRMSN